LIGALSTRRHVAVALAVTAGALAAATLTWRHAHPNRDGRVVVLDARTGAVIAARRLSGGWVAAALLPHRRVAVAAADGCAKRPILVFDEHLTQLRAGRSAYACELSQPNQVRAGLSGGEVQLLNDYWTTAAGLNVTLGRGRLVVHHDGVIVVFRADGRQLWRRDVGRPAGLVDVGQGLVVATVAGTYTPPPAA
jgi:outer membrane protein assembly factor BamB